MPTNFKKFMLARLLFRFGIEMQSMLLGWRMWELTHNTLFLALIGLAEAIPALGFSMHAGYYVDRSRPLMVTRFVGLGSLLSGVVMYLSQNSSLAFNGHAQIAALFAASVITGAARSFSQPATYALVPRLLDRRDLARASVWMSSVFQIAHVFGPMAGGLIRGWSTMVIATTVVCIILFIGILALLLIPLSSDPTRERPAVASTKEELLSGARFVFGHPLLLPALSLDMISVLFGGVTAMLPVYASDILNVGPTGLGHLRAASAIGALIMSLLLTRLGTPKRAGKWLFASVGGFGLCTLVFAVSRNFYLSLAILGLAGDFDSISVVIRGAAIQLASPDALRGRISAVNAMFIGSSNEIGEVESGTAAWLM